MTESRTRAVSEKLQHAFLVKLRNDRVRLTILAAELTRAADTAPALENIRLFAHEVRGAAAAFDVTAVEIAAHTLECAAAASTVLQADDSDVDAWAAIEALRDLLGSVGCKPAAL